MNKSEARTLWAGGCLTAACATAVLAGLIVRHWVRSLARPVPPDAVWAFYAGRGMAAVGRPAKLSSLGAGKWYLPPGTYHKLTIHLPYRPALQVVDPADIFIECKGDEVEAIRIDGNPVTVPQAVAKLQADATVWGWRPITADLNRWAANFTNKGELSSIANGDLRASFVPIVNEDIRPCGGTANPVCMGWYISWRPEER